MRHMVLILVVLGVAMPFTSGSLVPIPVEWQIHVGNGLSNGELFVHCKSKNDDLGIQNVSQGGEFQWSFYANIWGTTLFWCYLRKPDNGQVSFDAFWSESQHLWLEFRCTPRHTCLWTAKDDGIYLRNIPNNSDEKIHDWNN